MVFYEIFDFLHFIGLIFGVGGATIANIISRKAEKDKDVSKASVKIMPSISKLIWIGLLLLIISGIALPRFIEWPLDKNMLLVKHVLVAWIVIIGILIGSNMKKLKRFSPRGNEKPSLRFIQTRKRVKAYSTINLILWYLVTLLSVFV